MAKKKPDKAEDLGRVIENRKARHEYHILETLECGIVLRGPEVKSVRDGHVQITDGFVRIDGKPGDKPEMVAFGLNIEPYGPAGPRQHPPKRARRLLAHTREIKRLARQIDEKGMTIVPLKIYFKNGYAKLLIGVVKGKQKHDKRQAIAERETKRDLSRVMSKRMR